MYNPNTLGKYLREKRMERGLKLFELADAADISVSVISNVELGKVHSPSPKIINKLAEFYDVPAIKLAEMVDHPRHNLKVLLGDYVKNQNESTILLRAFRGLDWTESQQKQLAEAFSLVDNVMWECDRYDKKKEMNAIAGARFTLERLVTAFMVNEMVDKNK